MRTSNERDGSRRRSPTQTRGERRVERILEAAAALLAEVGYDALTLTEVAQQSGSAIGSLYHFFSSKDQLVDALVTRLVVHVQAMPAFVLKPSLATLTTEAFVRELFEPLAAFAGDHPEVPELMDRIVGRKASVDGDIAARLDAIVGARAPKLPSAERHMIVRVTIEVVRAGIRLVARSPKSSRRAVVVEVETVLVSYLRSRLGDSAVNTEP